MLRLAIAFAGLTVDARRDATGRWTVTDFMNFPADVGRFAALAADALAAVGIAAEPDAATAWCDYLVRNGAPVENEILVDVGDLSAVALQKLCR